MTAPIVDVRLYVGRGGSGKSALMRHHLKGEKRVIVLDANAEQHYAESCMVITDRAQLVEAVSGKTFRVAVRVPFGDKTAPWFEWANRCAWAAENCIVVWEEVHNYRIGSGLPPVGEQIVNQGRHHGVRVWAATRRPVNLRTLTASCTEINAFPTTEPNDLKFYTDLMGAEASAAAAALDPYHYVRWTEQGWTAEKPAKISE